MRWLMSANDPKRTCQIGGDGQIKEMALPLIVDIHCEIRSQHLSLSRHA
jgi:hypothetical protein